MSEFVMLLINEFGSQYVGCRMNIVTIVGNITLISL